MPLTGSGEITFNDFNIELGTPYFTQIGLDQAAQGFGLSAGPANTWVDSNLGLSLSEFYGLTGGAGSASFVDITLDTPTSYSLTAYPASNPSPTVIGDWLQLEMPSSLTNPSSPLGGNLAFPAGPHIVNMIFDADGTYDLNISITPPSSPSIDFENSPQYSLTYNSLISGSIPAIFVIPELPKNAKGTPWPAAGATPTGYVATVSAVSPPTPTPSPVQTYELFQVRRQANDKVLTHTPVNMPYEAGTHVGAYIDWRFGTTFSVSTTSNPGGVTGGSTSAPWITGGQSGNTNINEPRDNFSRREVKLYVAENTSASPRTTEVWTFVQQFYQDDDDFVEMNTNKAYFSAPFPSPANTYYPITVTQDGNTVPPPPTPPPPSTPPPPPPPPPPPFMSVKGYLAQEGGTGAPQTFFDYNAFSSSPFLGDSPRSIPVSTNPSSVPWTVSIGPGTPSAPGPTYFSVSTTSGTGPGTFELSVNQDNPIPPAIEADITVSTPAAALGQTNPTAQPYSVIFPAYQQSAPANPELDVTFINETGQGGVRVPSDGSPSGPTTSGYRIEVEYNAPTTVTLQNFSNPSYPFTMYKNGSPTPPTTSLSRSLPQGPTIDVFTFSGTPHTNYETYTAGIDIQTSGVPVGFTRPDVIRQARNVSNVTFILQKGVGGTESPYSSGPGGNANGIVIYPSSGVTQAEFIVTTPSAVSWTTTPFTSPSTMLPFGTPAYYPTSPAAVFGGGNFVYGSSGPTGIDIRPTGPISGPGAIYVGVPPASSGGLPSNNASPNVGRTGLVRVQTTISEFPTSPTVTLTREKIVFQDYTSTPPPPATPPPPPPPPPPPVTTFTMDGTNPIPFNGNGLTTRTLNVSTSPGSIQFSKSITGGDAPYFFLSPSSNQNAPGSFTVTAASTNPSSGSPRTATLTVSSPRGNITRTLEQGTLPPPTPPPPTPPTPTPPIPPPPTPPPPFTPPTPPPPTPPPTPPTVTFTASPTFYSVPYLGGTLSPNVSISSTTNAVVDISAISPWISTSPSGPSIAPSSFTITVGANSSLSSRIGSVDIAGINTPTNVTVTVQQGATPPPTPPPPPPPPPIRPPACVIKGTLITMWDGTKELVENLTIGDKLYSKYIYGSPLQDIVEIEKWTETNLNIKDVSTEVYSNKSEISDNIYKFNDGLLQTTEYHNHLIKRDGVWSYVKAMNVKIGDFFLNKNEEEVEIKNIERLNGEFEIFKLSVYENDLYIANDILTHNIKQEL